MTNFQCQCPSTSKQNINYNIWAHADTTAQLIVSQNYQTLSIMIDHKYSYNINSEIKILYGQVKIYCFNFATT